MMHFHIYRTKRRSTLLLRDHLRFIRKFTTTACLFKVKDHYKTLEVSRVATDEEVKTSYIRLAKLHHPDANVDRDSCHKMIAEINEAYEHLRDADKRKKYDELLKYLEQPSWRRHADGPPQGHAKRPHSYDYYRHNYRSHRPVWDEDLGRQPGDDSHKTWWQKNRSKIASYFAINAVIIHIFITMMDLKTERDLDDMVFAHMTPEQMKVYYDPDKCLRYRRTADMFDPKKVKEMAEREDLIKKLYRPPQTEQQLLGYLAENFKPLKVRAAPPCDNDSDVKNERGIEEIREKAKTALPSSMNEQESNRVTMHVEIPKTANQTILSS